MYVGEETKFKCENTKNPSITNPRTAVFFDLSNFNTEDIPKQGGFKTKEFDIT